MDKRRESLGELYESCDNSSYNCWRLLYLKHRFMLLISDTICQYVEIPYIKSYHIEKKTILLWEWDQIWYLRSAYNTVIGSAHYPSVWRCPTLDISCWSRMSLSGCPVICHAIHKSIELKWLLSCHFSYPIANLLAANPSRPYTMVGVHSIQSPRSTSVTNIRDSRWMMSRHVSLATSTRRQHWYETTSSATGPTTDLNHHYHHHPP